jgi:hypothetical protein
MSSITLLVLSPIRQLGLVGTRRLWICYHVELCIARMDLLVLVIFTKLHTQPYTHHGDTGVGGIYCTDERLLVCDNGCMAIGVNVCI